jgi:hypothetical protein
MNNLKTVLFVFKEVLVVFLNVVPPEGDALRLRNMWRFI